MAWARNVYCKKEDSNIELLQKTVRPKAHYELKTAQSKLELSQALIVHSKHNLELVLAV